MQKTEEWDGFFDFDKADNIYCTHFPGMPVVPGSLIIDSFVTACCELAGHENAVCIKEFAFKEFIAPGKYYFIIKKEGEVYLCFLYNRGEICSRGRIRI